MKAKNSGFTLIELLVVIGLVAVIVVMSISIGKGSIQRAAHANAVNMLISDISSVKQQAIKENRYFAIEFDSSGASYSIQRQTTVGNISTWTKISDVTPLDGDIFFDASKITGSWKGFAINPMGVVYDLPLVAGATPKSQQFSFFSKNKRSGVVTYQKTFIVYANGGIKIAD